MSGVPHHQQNSRGGYHGRGRGGYRGRGRGGKYYGHPGHRGGSQGRNVSPSGGRSVSPSSGSGNITPRGRSRDRNAAHPQPQHPKAGGGGNTHRSRSRQPSPPKGTTPITPRQVRFQSPPALVAPVVTPLATPQINTEDEMIQRLSYRPSSSASSSSSLPSRLSSGEKRDSFDELIAECGGKSAVASMMRLRIEEIRSMVTTSPFEHLALDFDLSITSKTLLIRLLFPLFFRVVQDQFSAVKGRGNFPFSKENIINLFAGGSIASGGGDKYFQMARNGCEMTFVTIMKSGGELGKNMGAFINVTYDFNFSLKSGWESEIVKIQINLNNLPKIGGFRFTEVDQLPYLQNLGQLGGVMLRTIGVNPKHVEYAYEKTSEDIFFGAEDFIKL